jgi:2-acylglycerol O-acyltransferase 2
LAGIAVVTIMTSIVESSDKAVNKLLGYAAFNGFFLAVIGFNLLVFMRLWYYPFKVGVYLILPYYTYTMVLSRSEHKDGGRWRYFSENFFIFPILRNHLQLNFRVPKALADAERAADAQFVIAVFPHGTASDHRVLMDGMLYNVLPNINEKIKVLAASVLFMIPLVREMAMWTGCVDARRSVAERALKKGNSILVLPGGEAEQIRTVYGKDKIYLKDRKGFVKLAMRHGVPIVPAYAFGVSDYYHTSMACFGPRLWLQKTLGVCIPLAAGLWGSVFCPLPVKTTIVFGAPLSFELKEKGSPTKEELDTAHAQFCKALRDLFDSHKQELGYGDRELEVF